MENFPRQVTSYTPKQSCLNSTWLHLTFESLPCLLTIMEQCHGNKCVLGNYSLFTLVTYITEEWGWTTRDLLLTSLKLYDYYWWTRFMLHTVKHDCISPPFYLMTRSIFRAAIKKFSCTQRRPLNDKLKPLFHVSLQSHLPVPTLPGLKLMTELLQLQQAVPGTQQTCPALPCLPLSCHSTSDVPTILMWLKGHCSPEWDPVWTLESWQSKHVCLPAPVNINVPLDCLLFVGQTRALHRGAKASTQTSCMAWEVIQLWPSSKNRFCNVLLLKPKPGRNYL